ncbi:MAG: serpin family protein, partial [Candidatus Binataceae bacterium]
MTGLIALATVVGITRAAEVSNAGVSALAKSDNGFGFRLLRALIGEQTAGNVIISPFSVAQALTMTYNGAGGETEKAMARTLGLSIKQRSRWAGYANGKELVLAPGLLDTSNRQLLAELKRADPKVQLAIVNALWIEKTFEVKPGFLRENQKFYDAKVQTLDFAHNPDRAAQIINAWVNDNTHGKIPTIVEGLH